MDGGDAPVGQSLDDYASQVAGINQKIDGIVKGGVLPQNDLNYERLKAQRDSIAARASALSDRAKKAGAEAPDFGAAVKKASAALKEPKSDPDAVKEYAAALAPAKTDAKPAETQDLASAPVGDAASKTPKQDEAHPLTDTVAAIREKYPQYKDVPDEKLIDGIYGKFYKGKMSREEFDKKLSDQKPEPSSVLRSLQIGTEAVGRGLGNLAGSVPETVNQVLNIPLRTINTVGGMVSGNDKLVPLLPENASATIKQAGAAAEKAVGVPERKLSPGEQTASDVEETATSLGPAIAAAPGAVKAAGSALKGVPGFMRGLLDDLTGSGAKKAMGEVRTTVGTEVAGAETASKAAATESEKRAQALSAKKAEVSANQPGTAAARADIVSATKPGSPDATLGRKGALTRLQTETAGTEKELAGAQGERAAAEKGVETATTAEGAAKDAAAQLDKTLMEKPGISKEEFGAELEKTVRDTNERLTKTRAKEADYGGVLERAGDEPRVDTEAIHQRIQDIVNKSVRNPTTRKQLEALDRELVNEVGGEAHNALSLKQADSLRKTINEAVSKEIYAGDAVSKEAAAHLKEIGKMLTREATEASPEYKTALGKFSTHSRPLEFIEKNPLLRKVVADHPGAAEAAVTRSQIVGRLITEANKADRKALSRLVTESPELRNAARLHFTEDLFGGPNGLRDAKSEDQMRKWLVKNKSALDQLGLTAEFRDIKAARETANKAIADAAGTLKQSKQTLAEAAKKEAEIQKRLKATQKLRALSQSRVGEAENARVKALAERQAATEQRASAAQKRLGTQAEEATGSAAKKQKAATEYNRIATDLGRKNADVPAEAKKAVEALRKGGHINEKQYAQMRDRIDEAIQKTQDTKKLRLTVAKIIGAGILLNQVGYPVYRAFMTSVGH